MNKTLDLTRTSLKPGIRVRLVKDALIVEPQKPNFITRFIRWIKGEYNDVKICGKVHALVIAQLKNPQPDPKKLQTLANNYALFIERAKGKKKFSLNKHQKALAGLQNAMRVKIIPSRAVLKPVATEKPGFQPSLLTSQRSRLRQVNPISPIESAWKSIVENKSTPLNALSTLPFAHRLASAEQLFNWICDGLEHKPVFHMPEGKSEAQTLDCLMHLLGISTPQSCIDHGLEPTEASIDKWIRDQQDTWITLATSLGCIKIDEQVLMHAWLEACEEESYDDIQNESVALFSTVDFLHLLMNADAWVSLVFGEEKPLLSWNDPQNKYKRLPDQSVFSQNQLSLLRLQSVGAFVHKQIMPTTESMKNYLRANERECQTLVRDYLERQNYLRT